MKLRHHHTPEDEIPFFDYLPEDRENELIDAIHELNDSIKMLTATLFMSATKGGAA